MAQKLATEWFQQKEVKMQQVRNIDSWSGQREGDAAAGATGALVLTLRPGVRPARRIHGGGGELWEQCRPAEQRQHLRDMGRHPGRCEEKYMFCYYKNDRLTGGHRANTGEGIKQLCWGHD